jgi:hypothetical protein
MSGTKAVSSASLTPTHPPSIGRVHEAREGDDADVVELEALCLVAQPTWSIPSFAVTQKSDLGMPDPGSVDRLTA